VDFDVLMLGSGTARVLARSGLTGSVHSLFDRAVNLRLAGRIVTLQHSSLPRTPLMLAVNPAVSFRDLCLVPGSRVRVEQGSVMVKGHRFCYTAAPAWDARLPLSFSAEAQVMVLRQGVSRALDLAASPRGPGGLGPIAGLCRQNLPPPDRGSPLLQAAVPVLEALLAAAGQERELELIPALTTLIGLGPGLTPSGDDFLVGFLSVLSLLEKGNPRIGSFARALRQAIREAGQEKTTPVSREFLLAACSGEFSEPFHRLYRAAAALDGPGTLAAAVRFTGIGHTSGIDGLTGIIYGLSLWRPLLCLAPAAAGR